MNHASIRRLVMTALCVALGVVLPQALHAIPNAGNVLLPMHIPVLLCGLCCGWTYGLGCGVLTPALSHLISGMPPAAVLPAMICELAAYGLIAGFTARFLHTGKRTADIYIQLISAMLLGRVVYGVANALIFRAGAYSMEVFLTAAFVTALPGIILQLVLLPALILILEKARVLEAPTVSQNPSKIL